MERNDAVHLRAARVFLSYKRNVEPDQALAAEVVAGRRTPGIAVFIDQRLTVGQAWARRSRRRSGKPST